MTVIASGEIDLKLSKRSQAALENDLAKVSNQAGGKSGESFSKGFGGKLSGLKGALGNAFKSIGPQAIAGAVGAAGGAIAAFAAKSIAHFNETAQSVRAFQRVSGENAKSASQFVSAFDDMGISADKATGAFTKLAKNVGDGGQKLTDLGIQIGHTNSGTADLRETFLNVADAVSKTEDPARRVEIAMAAFGKTGAALLPILEKGRKGIEELFRGADLNFTQAQLDSAEDYRLAMDHLGDSVGKVENRIGAALVPALADATEGFAVLIDKGIAATQSSGFLGDALHFLGDVAVNTVAPGIQGVAAGLGLLSDGADDSKLSADELSSASQALGLSVENLSGKTRDQVIALGEQKKALDAVYNSTLASFDANFAYQDSLNATEDAAALVTEKQNALNEAVKAHTANSPEATAATEDLSRALLSQQEQALRSADAAGRVAEQNAIMGGALDGTGAKIDAQITELKRQRDQIAGAGGNTLAIQGMIDKLEEIKGEYPVNITLPGIGGVLSYLDRVKNAVLAAQRGSAIPGGFSSHGSQGSRAGGGPLWPGDWIVAENTSRAEILHLNPGSSGYVVGQDTTRRLTQNDNRQVSITVMEAVDPHVTAYAIARTLGEQAQR